jgi:peptidoglycan/xylan/chitin deacetylase (PgdA/CDA1 family)
MERSFTCLMYHGVYGGGAPCAGFSPSITAYSVARSAFDRQLQEISALGGWTLTPEDLKAFYALRPGEGDRPWRPGYPVLLTFDDGWLDSVEEAGPLLEAHRCTAMFFVTTDFVGRPYFVSRGDLQRLPRDWFRIGSHARSHRMLSLLSEREIRAELADSKSYLEDVTGDEVDAVSIPGGAVDPRVRRIAVEVGYRLLFTSEVRANHRGDSPMDIGRVAVKSTTALESFRGYVRQRFARQRLRRLVLQVPKRVLGLARYERLRRRLLGEVEGQFVSHEPV